MKKYYLADVLSATEILMAIVLLIMAKLKVAADYAIWVFVAGELCDAFDGICARRWPYPEGEKHWWRIPWVVRFIEHASDISLALACMTYLMIACDFNTRYAAFIGGGVIAVTCLAFEIVIESQAPNSTKTTPCIITRRWIYISALAYGIVLLLINTSWPDHIKIILAGIGIIIGIVLVVIKRNRAFKP